MFVNYSKSIKNIDLSENLTTSHFATTQPSQSSHHFASWQHSGFPFCAPYYGQAFALMEAKIILAMLISRFSFTISENYRHAPVVILTIKPKYGVQVCLKPLEPWRIVDCGECLELKESFCLLWCGYIWPSWSWWAFL